MSYLEEWKSLSASIKGMANAGHLYAAFQAVNTEDTWGAGKFLRRQSAAVVKSIETFSKYYEIYLPDEPKKCIQRYLAETVALVAMDETSDHRGARAALVGLIAFEAEMTLLLSSRQEAIKRRSERAFMLLQRTIAVDDDVRAKWKKSLQDGEVKCEKLGSIHLLSQGVFAFKVDATGARTDLVFSEPLNTSELARAVEGLVLTEWKVATPKNAMEKFQEAKAQADLYAAGAMAGLELTTYRYLVLVTEKELPPAAVPADEVGVNGTTYRHINISVDPSTPSKVARAKRP